MVITNKNTSKDTLHPDIHYSLPLPFSVFYRNSRSTNKFSRKNPDYFTLDIIGQSNYYSCAPYHYYYVGRRRHQRNIGFEKTDPNTAKKYKRMMISCLESCAHNCISVFSLNKALFVALFDEQYWASLVDHDMLWAVVVVNQDKPLS